MKERKASKDDKGQIPDRFVKGTGHNRVMGGGCKADLFGGVVMTPCERCVVARLDSQAADGATDGYLSDLRVLCLTRARGYASFEFSKYKR